jgi:hypothetical protein
VPLVGVNQGRLGFMTDIARDDMLTCMDDLLDGRFTPENRMLLAAEVTRDGKEIAANMALNDVVVDKGAIGRMIEFELFIDGEFIYNLRSDGLIVSTPTGSTAYSMSAGGPILHPTLTGIALVPLCPHALSNRPIIVNDNTDIELRIASADDPRVHFDGQVTLDFSAAIASACVVPNTRSASCIRRATAISPCCARNCSGANGRKGPDAAPPDYPDFVIVDRLELSFAGFRRLDRETGAGKSILIDALALAFGERADAGVVRSGCDKAEVAATFEIAACPRCATGWSNDLDGDDELLLRRVVDAGGRLAPTSTVRRPPFSNCAKSANGWSISTASMPTSRCCARCPAPCSTRMPA